MDNNRQLSDIISMARDIKKHPDATKEIKDMADSIIEDAQIGKFINKKRVDNMEEWFLRRPEYPDDWVGRPADDFDF